MEELLDQLEENRKKHPERIAILTGITIAMTVLFLLAGEAGFFEGFDKMFIIPLLVFIPILSVGLAIVSAYPNSIKQAENLNYAIIVSYSLIPFVYAICFSLFILYDNILSLRLNLLEVIEVLTVVTLISGIPSVIIASVILARLRALSGKRWFLIPSLAFLIIVALSIALYYFILFID